MQRVVVTGLGIVCPLGAGADQVWRRLVASQSGITAITAFNSHGLSSRVAGQVPPGLWSEAPSPGGALPGRGSRVGQLALLAARQAVEDAGWQPREESRDMAGVSIGSGCGGLEALHEAAQRLQPGPPGTGADQVLPATMIHHLAVEVARSLDLRGPRRAVSTACSSGAHAIGDAARLIACGDAEVMLAGGTEAAGLWQPRSPEHRSARGGAVPRSCGPAGSTGGAGLAAAGSGHLRPAGPPELSFALPRRGQPEPGC